LDLNHPWHELRRQQLSEREAASAMIAATSSTNRNTRESEIDLANEAMNYVLTINNKDDKSSPINLDCSFSIQKTDILDSDNHIEAEGDAIINQGEKSNISY